MRDTLFLGLVRRLIALLGLCPIVCMPAVAAGEMKAGGLGDEQVERCDVGQGRRLFLRRWEAETTGDDAGDGLGPMFNDVSCVACHRLGGIGGAGSDEKNVTMLTVVPPPDGMSTRRFVRLAKHIHPGFASSQGRISTSIVLHASSSDPRYDRQRRRLLGLDFSANVPRPQQQAVETWAKAQKVRIIPHASGVRLLLSQRNSPALFGAGLIDQISDRALRRLARKQQQQGVVSGQVATSGNRVGRFGWKAQTATLAEFVRQACANELGLQVPGAAQASNPLNPRYQPIGCDLDAKQLKRLTQFIASLPQPSTVAPVDRVAKQSVERGKRVFHEVGCAQCHVETIAETQLAVHGIYSDLLLHDMGPSLADPLQQPELLTGTVTSNPRRSNSYGGAPLLATQTVSLGVVASPGDRQWRTPPLWGVADSAPYLHDGRARSLAEAILMHGGEASFSVTRYRAGNSDDQQALIDFLKTLVAPGQ